VFWSIDLALLSLQALLSTPEPNDPQDAVVAKQYKTDFAGFAEKAKHWTATHADPNAKLVSPFQDKIDRLVEMGFAPEKAQGALDKFDGDENRAIDFLFNS